MAGPRSIKKAIRQSAGDISDRSTCAANSTATGSGIKSADLGKKAKFTITSRDSQDRERKLGGDVYAVKLNKEGYEVKVDVKTKATGRTWQNILSLMTISCVSRHLIVSREQFSTHCPCAW